MSDIENRVVAILAEYYGDIELTGYSCARKITEVFAEAGYVQVVDNPHGIGHVQVADFSGGKLSKLLTGQEWYDRFQKELAKTPVSKTHFDTGADFLRHAGILQQVHDTARRAAGIEDTPVPSPYSFLHGDIRSSEEGHV